MVAGAHALEGEQVVGGLVGERLVQLAADVYAEDDDEADAEDPHE